MNARLSVSLAAAVVIVPVCCIIAPIAALVGIVTICAGATEPAVEGAFLSTWDEEQLANAATIVAVGVNKDVPRRGWVIAVATAIQESGLRNLGHLGARNDHDSLGLFQQRPSQGWGSPAQILDPRYAAGKFYDKLLTVPDWQHLPLTRAAQAVQVSAYPDAYAQWEDRATQLVNHIAGPGQNCAGLTGPWVMPVDGTVTSGFRPSDRPTHDGIDFAAPKGTPVRAAGAGTVIVVACNAALNGAAYSCDRDGTPAVTGCGWYLEILHAGDLVTRYCHLLRRPEVGVGVIVAGGQAIGVVGSSGNSSGPHLHFEVHTGRPATSGNAVDPLPFLPDHRLTPPTYALRTTLARDRPRLCDPFELLPQSAHLRQGSNASSGAVQPARDGWRCGASGEQVMPVHDERRRADEAVLARIVFGGDDRGAHDEMSEPDVVQGLAQEFVGSARMRAAGDDLQFNVHGIHYAPRRWQAARPGSRPGPGGCRAVVAQPGRQVRGAAADRGVQGCEVVVSDPVDIPAAVEKELGGALLATVTGHPQRGRDVLLRRAVRGQMCADAVNQTERRGLAQSRPGATLDEAPRGVPLPERGCVRQRGATSDDRTVGLDVRASVEQRVQHHHIIAARGPVQRRLPMRTSEPSVDIGTGADQQRHSLRPAREVTRKVRSHVQQRATHVVRMAKADRRKPRVLVEQTLKGVRISTVDRRHSRLGQRVIRGQESLDRSRLEFNTRSGCVRDCMLTRAVLHDPPDPTGPLVDHHSDTRLARQGRAQNQTAAKVLESERETTPAYRVDLAAQKLDHFVPAMAGRHTAGPPLKDNIVSQQRLDSSHPAGPGTGQLSSFHAPRLGPPRDRGNRGRRSTHTASSDRSNFKIKCREGWRVQLQHADEVATTYCHAQTLTVHAGQTVRAGEVIGFVGSTGNSTGNHLHFQVHVHAPPISAASTVDPAAFLRTRGITV